MSAAVVEHRPSTIEKQRRRLVPLVAAFVVGAAVASLVSWLLLRPVPTNTTPVDVWTARVFLAGSDPYKAEVHVREGGVGLSLGGYVPASGQTFGLLFGVEGSECLQRRPQGQLVRIGVVHTEPTEVYPIGGDQPVWVQCL